MIVTLILGILSVALCALNLILPIVHIVGVVLGLVDLAVISRYARSGHKYSRPGMILAFIGVALGVGMMLYGIISSLI